jgi:hypothetical protein
MVTIILQILNIVNVELYHLSEMPVSYSFDGSHDNVSLDTMMALTSLPTVLPQTLRQNFF